MFSRLPIGDLDSNYSVIGQNMRTDPSADQMLYYIHTSGTGTHRELWRTRQVPPCQACPWCPAGWGYQAPTSARGRPRCPKSGKLLVSYNYLLWMNLFRILD